MLIGLNSAISMFGGGVLAWGLIGPLLVHYGECIGVDISEDDPKWKGMYNFGKLTNQDKETPSPRFWLLWPAVMVMICSSMVELVIRKSPFLFSCLCCAGWCPGRCSGRPGGNSDRGP